MDKIHVGVFVTNPQGHCYDKRGWSVQSNWAAGLWENEGGHLVNSQHFTHSAFLSQNSTLFSDLVMQSAWFSDRTEETLKVSCAFLTDKEKYCLPLFTDLLSKQCSALLRGCFHDFPLVKVIGFYTETSSSPVSVGAHFTTALDAPPGPGGNLAL